MGMSANRNPGQAEAQAQGPIRAPVAAQIPVGAPPVSAAPMQGIQPFQYPRLQHAAASGNPLGAMLGKLLMGGLENRRQQMGANPQDWQNHLNAMLAMKRGLPIP